MKTTMELLESLRALAFDADQTNIAGLRQVLVHERGGRVIEDVVRDYLLAHWNLDHDYLEQLSSQWILVDPGPFKMGSPLNEPGRRGGEEQHDVVIDRRFVVQAYPVTQEQWFAVMGSNPSSFEGAKRPVECVTWWAAATYCNALSKKEGLEEVYTIEPSTVPDWRREENVLAYLGDSVDINAEASGYRLLRDAQWEYVCRAGTVEPTYAGAPQNAEWSSFDPVLNAIAWYKANSNGSTQDVCQKQPNGWGIYDMLGNVWEWTEDVYTGPEAPARELGPHHYWGRPPSPERVIRGGSWAVGYALNLRSANRAHNTPDYASDDLGFRCARYV